MKKINNKGFLLVETLIVATFCLTVLVILFLQFKNLVITYNNSYKYNTVEDIYNLNTLKRYLTQNSFSLSASSSPYYVLITDTDSLNNRTICKSNYNILENGVSKNNNYCDELITAGGFKTVIYTSSNLTNLKSNMPNFSEGFKNFINQLNNDNSKANRLIAEFNNETYASITY